MKKIVILICFVMVMSLCACGSKTQPTPTAAPTAVPTEAPAEASTEVSAEPAAAEPEAEAVAEEIPDSYDPESFGSVYAYYNARGEKIYGAYAFMQLDTEGKKTWTAPMAGIQEFKVPDAFLNAKGGVRASGGQELIEGSGIVALDVMYLPFTEAEYNAFLDGLAAFVKEHEDLTDENRAAYAKMVDEYTNNAYVLFEVFGIANNASLDELKTTMRELAQKNGITEEDTEAFLSNEFIEAGSADDYNFYLIRSDRASESFTESQAEYKEEYDALYDAIESYTSNFTFMRPLALAQVVAQGTGFTFETKDLDGNTVNSAELFTSHKATMVNIWETTCGACMSEMAELKKQAEEFEAKGGQIIGLVYDAVDDDMIREAKDIAEDLGLNFVNLIPTQEMKDFFKTQAFPTTYFFDSNGVVAADPVMGAAPDLYILRMDEILGK